MENKTTKYNRAVLIASGSLVADQRLKKELAPQPFDLVISVDGGARHLESLELTPHVIIGDFDSIEDLKSIEAKYPDAEVLRFKAKKDQTDSELAMDYAMEQGCTEIVIFGATGTRLDHTFANVLMLSKATRKGIRAKIVDNHNSIHYLEAGGHNSCILNLNGLSGETLSILPISEQLKGVETEGLEYIVREGVIDFGSSYGISNVITSDSASVKLGEGRALVMVSRD